MNSVKPRQRAIRGKEVTRKNTITGRRVTVEKHPSAGRKNLIMRDKQNTNEVPGNLTNNGGKTSGYTKPAPVLSFLTPSQADALADVFFRAATSNAGNASTNPYQHEDAARAFDLANQLLALPSHWRIHVQQAIEDAYTIGDDRQGVAMRETWNWVRQFQEFWDYSEEELSLDFEMSQSRVQKFRHVVVLLNELAEDTL